MMTSNERALISKLLGMMGSAHDAEALAAARKADEIVKAAGTTWPDLLGIEASPPEAAHVTEARELLSRGKGIITDWERKFLIGVMAHRQLQPKQAAILADLRTKISAAAL